MLNILSGLVLLVGVGQDDPTEQLVAACKKLHASESYTFESSTQQSGGGGGMRGGGPEGQAPPATIGRYQKNRPLHLSQGQMEAYKQGQKMVFRNAEGEWQPFEPTGLGGGFDRGQRGQGGQRPPRGEGGGDRPPRGEGSGDRPPRGGEGVEGPPPGGEGGQRGERPPRGQGGGRGDRGSRRGNRGARAIYGVARLQAPHEQLQDLRAYVTDVARKQAGESFVYTGTLTEKGLMGLSGRSGMGRTPGGRGDGQGPQIEQSGTFMIRTSASGVIETIEYDIKLSGSFGERSFERNTKTKVAIKDIGTTKVELPEGVKTKLDNAIGLNEREV